MENRNTNVDFVTIDDIIKTLEVRRNFIYKKILPYVEYQKMGNETKVNKEMLCDWLMENAEFTRQTVLVPESELRNYAEKFHEKYPSDFFGVKVEGLSMKRKQLPFRRVTPLDVWRMAKEGKILHPKLAVGDIYKSDELLYRDMFKRGAIKITLSGNKTFFYVPEGEGVLCPAMDEVTEFIGVNVKGTKKFGGKIKAEGDSVFLRNLIDILRHHYNIEESKIHEKNFEFIVSKYFEVQI